MSVTLTIVVSTADQARLQPALAGLGIANPAALVVGRIQEIVKAYEAEQAAAAAQVTFQAAMDAQTAAYQPIVPAVTVTPGP